MESDNESLSPPTSPRKKAKLTDRECQYDWLTSDPLCEFNAKCKICAITFTISHAGVGQVCYFCLRLACLISSCLFTDMH